MGAFQALEIANSSLGMHQTWLDALAYNISNANTFVRSDQTAFQAQYVIASAKAGGDGVEVAGVAYSDPEGRLRYEPDHPLADAEGLVRAPEMDMASQMSQLVMAQRGYQASVSVTKTAQEEYASALSIGKA